MNKFLIIQTAFIGDVVLATPVIESLRAAFPDAKIDFVLRKGNEGLLEGHPHVDMLYIWNKKGKKYKNLLRILKAIRRNHYDYVINLQRFASTGFLTAFSKGKQKIGFKKNPFSWAFTIKINHRIEKGVHETDRNLDLIRSITNKINANQKLHPSQKDFEFVRHSGSRPYVCIAPASVWYTKQLPAESWIELCKKLSETHHLYFLGAPSDTNLCEKIIKESGANEVTDYCGKLSFLQSAALMKNAAMNYVNDSAPLHFASAMNAPVTAFFCSTIPEFGFGPKSEKSIVAQIDEPLKCRPCGLHGKKSCPESHFNCGYKIKVENYLT